MKIQVKVIYYLSHFFFRGKFLVINYYYEVFTFFSTTLKIFFQFSESSSSEKISFLLKKMAKGKYSTHVYN